MNKGKGKLRKKFYFFIFMFLLNFKGFIIKIIINEGNFVYSFKWLLKLVLVFIFKEKSDFKVLCVFVFFF